jgi:hypothetical protein
MRGRHQEVARATANPYRAARPARLQWRWRWRAARPARLQWRWRWRAARRGAGSTPASFPVRFDARGRPQSARVTSSPPCATPGRLLDDGEATTAADVYGGGTRVLARLGASEGGG